MSARELDAAGITEPDLRASYELCRRISAAHGRTYYLATLLLPPEKRPYVHALYGFARRADDIVDVVDQSRTTHQRAAELESFGSMIIDGLRAGRSDDPVGRALVDTARRWSIPAAQFESFLASMTMDLTVDAYQTYDDLLGYVRGSAVAIGLEMVPILGPLAPQAYDRAADLAIAFQLANFIRDVGEDLNRGRVYLPLDELAGHGVTRADLERRVITPELIAALQFQIGRVRDLSSRSYEGIEMLDPSSRDCIEAARELYVGIVDEVEANGYDVFTKRATVPLTRRLRVFLPAWRRARQARG